MNRRSFFKPSAPYIQTAPTVRWRLASSFSRSLDTIYGAAEVLADRVSALTDGKFQIRAYPGGELVPGLEVLDAVQKGTTQIGHTAGYYYIGKNPALAFDTSVPFGLNVHQYNAWLQSSGMDLLRSLFADFNIINLPGGNTGVQMGGWFRQPVNALSDMQGLKMRIPGMGGKVMNELGVTVQVLASGDIFPALERGTIDATEWSGPYDDEKLGFFKVAPHYYYPGWWEPGPGLSFYINQQAWDQLPVTYQHALTAAAEHASMDMVNKYDAKNPPALQRLLDQDVDIQPFPEDFMQAAYDTSIALMEQEASADPAYARIYRDYMDWRTATARWLGTAPQTYANFAFDRLAI
ncbi:MAG: TRAP transporter substrate-binding protein [Rhodothermales bacterium]